jgi:dTDP-4-amino-4,6-dideoxygalactose transaminase
MLREYGWESRYISNIVGRNSRLDELQAAVLRIKLRNLDSDNQKRRQIASEYSALLDGAKLQLPSSRENSEEVFHLYVVTSPKRQELFDHLQKHGIQAGIHYPMPIHLQPAYQGRIKTATNMKETERLSKKVLSLPMYPELSNEDILKVISAINSNLAPY